MIVRAHEGTAWLRGAVARRLAQLDRLDLGPTRGRVIVCPLDRGAEPGSREDRTCDRCRSYVPDGRPFVTGLVQPRTGVLLAYGLCGTCADLEVPS